MAAYGKVEYSLTADWIRLSEAIVNDVRMFCWSWHYAGCLNFCEDLFSVE